MMILWKYIDKIKLTISVLQDMNTMLEIIEITPVEIIEEYSNIQDVPSIKFDQVFKKDKSKKQNFKIDTVLDHIEILRKRYSEAAEYICWIKPAWDKLSASEQHLLQEFYLTGNQKSGATTKLQEELNYSDRQIERIKQKALKHLTTLLFGY